MNEPKNTAILEITYQDGYEFVKKGVTIHQSNALGGVAIELFIPTVVVSQDNALDALIAQAQADKKAFPNTWYHGWQWRFGESWLSGDSPYYNVENNRHQNRRHPHADIIMLCEQDKIDYPDFWHKLTQWSNFNEDKWHGVPFDADTLYEFNKYRQHPHRKNIIAWHACSDADKKRWDFKDAGMKWKPVKTQCPLWLEEADYRLRPRTCSVTIQGVEYEYPEPVHEALIDGRDYWAVGRQVYQFRYDAADRENIINDLHREGVLHLTKEAAEQHLAVLQAINSQVAL